MIRLSVLFADGSISQIDAQTSERIAEYLNTEKREMVMYTVFMHPKDGELPLPLAESKAFVSLPFEHIHVCETCGSLVSIEEIHKNYQESMASERVANSLNETYVKKSEGGEV